MTTNIVYVVKDGGSDRYCKIGKDTYGLSAFTKRNRIACGSHPSDG